MSGTTQHPCPKCGMILEKANADAMCPACLMSGVLQDDLETVPIDHQRVNQAIASPALRRIRTAFELPYELGDYTLISLLGQGGMGTVYEAEQRSTGRRLAIKLLGHNLDSPEMRQRFLREGRLAARVNHPASLYVFGSEEIDGIPVISMEIAPGGTLQDALDRRGALPVTEAVDAVLSMIDGLEAAFDRGVLHRDIKPSNCFVSPDGTVKVGDFGLSVSTLPSADSLITQTGKVMGTPAFASPEQLRGDEVDVRADVYSVGATLFTLLTARAAFEGDNAVQVVANVIDTPAPPVSRFRDDIPNALEQVINRCLAKERTGRYADYTSLRNALLPFSSVVPEPATQAQRTAAGWIDYLTAFLPTYATLMIAVGPEALLIRPLYEFTFNAWRYYLLLFVLGFLYFALSEGIWGAGLGKWVMNLRLVRKDGRSPGVILALLRIIVPITFIESIRIPLTIALLPSGVGSSIEVLTFIGLSIACPWIVALLWITARRSNGFATVWDLVTGTRVVVRPRGTRRPALLGKRDDEHIEHFNTDSKQPQRIGPFHKIAEIEPGGWLLAHDPVLRRSVWLIRRGSNPISEARRSVARPGRPRWLQEIVYDGQVWDAMEASRGSPLTEHIGRGRVAWSSMRYWLYDLAAELRAAERDGTLAHAYSMDNVWISDDGRAMLFDTPWPCSRGSTYTTDTSTAEPVAVDTLAGQQCFVQRVADHVDPLSVPLHAQPVLQNLRIGSYDKLTFLTGTLRSLLNKPADVSVGLRAAALFVIPGYAWIATFVGIGSNTDPSVDPIVWVGRVAIAGLVMLNIIAFFDITLALWRKSTGLSTFGLEVVTPNGRASRKRMFARSAIMWLPVVVPSAAIAVIALKNGTWIDFNTAAILGGIGLVGAGLLAISALTNPVRGLHDRLAGAWVGRR